MTNQEARGILVGLEAAYRDLDPLAFTDDGIQLLGEVIEIEYNPWIEKINGILKRMRTAESILQLNEIHNLAKRQIFELWMIRCEELKRRKNERQENDRKDH